MGEKKLEKLFVEYLLPCDKEKKEDLIKKATIIIDTNVLLNCYRWSRETAEQFLNLLEQLSDRIWFSYYVLKEFFNKRIYIIQKKEADLKKIEDEIDKKIKELKKKIEETNSKRELKAQDFSEELQKLEQIKDSISKKIERELKQIVNIFDDWILDRITNLVKNNVGCSFPEKEYNLILHEGKERYEKEILLIVNKNDPLSENKNDPPPTFYFHDTFQGQLSLETFIFELIFEPITGSINVKNFCMVDYSVNNSSCHHIILKDLSPLLKAIVTCEDNRALLITHRD